MCVERTGNILVIVVVSKEIRENRYKNYEL